jgi:hypothetical protein
MLKIKLFLITTLLIQTANLFAQEFEITKTSFKDLYNNYRVATPKNVPWAGNFFPYSDFGTAVKLDGDGDEDSKGRSPIETYGIISRTGKDAYNWEKSNHSCEGLSEEAKESCEAWWGHCNGWAAAAVKEKEPKKPIIFQNTNLSIADQKGILTELWLASYSMNAGETDKSKKTGSWVHGHSRPSSSYKSFWDVTPKTFFHILTNYVGALRTGIVIDRFTGDEVWNQPVVGYRMLPIKKSDISIITEGTKKYWSVRLSTKIFWANDSGIPAGHVSAPFNIKKTSDNEDEDDLTRDYESRLLSYRLNFSSQVKISEDGKSVLAAGKIIGDGLWHHQENSKDFSSDELNRMHPDFIWLPTSPYQDSSGYGNPYVSSKIVEKMLKSTETNSDSGTTPTPTNTILSLVFAPRVFGGSTASAEEIKKAVQNVIRREGIKHAIYLSGIEISRNRIKVVVRFPEGVNSKALIKLFDAAEMPVKLEVD